MQLLRRAFCAVGSPLLIATVSVVLLGASQSLPTRKSTLKELLAGKLPLDLTTPGKTPGGPNAPNMETLTSALGISQEDLLPLMMLLSQNAASPRSAGTTVAPQPVFLEPEFG